MGEKPPSAGRLFLPLPQPVRQQASTWATPVRSSETDPQAEEKGTEWLSNEERGKISDEQKQSLRYFPLL